MPQPGDIVARLTPEETGLLDWVCAHWLSRDKDQPALRLLEALAARGRD